MTAKWILTCTFAQGDQEFNSENEHFFSLRELYQNAVYEKDSRLEILIEFMYFRFNNTCPIFTDRIEIVTYEPQNILNYTVKSYSFDAKYRTGFYDQVLRLDLLSKWAIVMQNINYNHAPIGLRKIIDDPIVLYFYSAENQEYYILEL